jgi:hypothetical protein
MENKASETLDPPCLIPATSPAGETNHKEQINTSQHITTDEGEPALNSPDNAYPYLRTFNEIYGSLSEGSTSASPVGDDEDVNMETNAVSPQDTGTDQLRLSDDITSLLDEDTSGEHITTNEHFTSNEHINTDPEQTGDLVHTFQGETPVLTVEAFNDIHRLRRQEQITHTYLLATQIKSSSESRNKDSRSACRSSTMEMGPTLSVSLLPWQWS